MRHRAASARRRFAMGASSSHFLLWSPADRGAMGFNPRSTEHSRRGVYQLEEADPLTTAITVSVVGKRRRSTLHGDRTTTSAPECIVVGIYYHAPNPSWGRE